MIAVQPYSAERQILRPKDGGLKHEWEACRVVGITEEDGEPVYVIEVYDRGEQWLDTANLLRKRA